MSTLTLIENLNTLTPEHRREAFSRIVDHFFEILQRNQEGCRHQGTRTTFLSTSLPSEKDASGGRRQTTTRWAFFSVSQ